MTKRQRNALTTRMDSIPPQDTTTLTPKVSPLVDERDPGSGFLFPSQSQLVLDASPSAEKTYGVRPVKRRLSLVGTTVDNITQTQDIDYVPSSQVEPISIQPSWAIQDAVDGATHRLDTMASLSIGRCAANTVVVPHPSVSANHVIVHALDHAALRIAPLKPIWFFDETTTRWKKFAPFSSSRRTDIKLSNHQRFRLLPPSKSTVAVVPGIEWVVHDPSVHPAAHGGSLDEQYLRLLQRVQTLGLPGSNKKGSNRTLRDHQVLVIDLSCDDNTDLNRLQLLTLRNIFQGSGAIVELLWYLRGESHIQFLRDMKCKFWDQQAEDDGFVGLNYGLLTNFPALDGTYVNQLEKHVIDPLCRGESSRNMCCTLLHPTERTVQNACSSSIQFAVSNSDTLDMTVTQRSSDIILGLPNDVLVFQILLHLVRREVKRRSQRILKAGKVVFCISAGGAHVYDINWSSLQVLLERKPYRGNQPHSLVIESDEGIFAMARNYQKSGGPSRIYVDGYETFHPSIKIQQALSNKKSCSKHD